MPNGARFSSLRARDLGPEVLVADTDALLGDACDTLVSGLRSELLRAVDTSTAIAFMSEQTYLELGRMSAVCARGRGVNHDALRALLIDSYLPRVPVIRTSSSTNNFWLPAVDGVRDIDDVPHAQAARLIGANAVYSHDKHLRRPGFAPADRDHYNHRVAQLSALSARHETEQSAGLVVAVASGGVSEVVSRASVWLKVKPSVLWLGLAVGLVAVTYVALSPTDRRRRFLDAAAPLVERIAVAVARSDAARQVLAAGALIPIDNADRIEVRVAMQLARHPDQNMTELSEHLALTPRERRELPALLRHHPSFEPSSRYGWSVGQARTHLATQPPTTWTTRFSSRGNSTPATADHRLHPSDDATLVAPCVHAGFQGSARGCPSLDGSRTPAKYAAAIVATRKADRPGAERGRG